MKRIESGKPGKLPNGLFARALYDRVHKEHAICYDWSSYRGSLNTNGCGANGASMQKGEVVYASRQQLGLLLHPNCICHIETPTKILEFALLSYSLNNHAHRCIKRSQAYPKNSLIRLAADEKRTLCSSHYVNVDRNAMASMTRYGKGGKKGKHDCRP